LGCEGVEDGGRVGGEVGVVDGVNVRVSGRRREYWARIMWY
jgi:hypothetical protein